MLIQEVSNTLAAGEQQPSLLPVSSVTTKAAGLFDDIKEAFTPEADPNAAEPTELQQPGKTDTMTPATELPGPPGSGAPVSDQRDEVTDPVDQAKNLVKPALESTAPDDSTGQLHDACHSSCLCGCMPGCMSGGRCGALYIAAYATLCQHICSEGPTNTPCN